MVFWNGIAIGSCSIYLPVPIRAPKPCRWGSVSFLAVFRVACLALSTGCFLFLDWFCSEKVYPQTRRAYYLFSYYLLFTICMSWCFSEGFWPKSWCFSEGFGLDVVVFQRGKLSQVTRFCG